MCNGCCSNTQFAAGAALGYKVDAGNERVPPDIVSELIDAHSGNTETTSGRDDEHDYR